MWQSGQRQLDLVQRTALAEMLHHAAPEQYFD